MFFSTREHSTEKPEIDPKPSRPSTRYDVEVPQVPPRSGLRVPGRDVLTRRLARLRVQVQRFAEYRQSTDVDLRWAQRVADALDVALGRTT